jgi:hypothetical protein
MYADDLQIYPSASIFDLQMCYDEVDLQRTFDWAGLMDGKSIQKESGHTY